MIGISTRVFPYRLECKSKEPIELFVTLTNGTLRRQLSIDIALDDALSFDRVKPEHTAYKRLGEFGPSQSKELVFYIYPVVGAMPGSKQVQIRVGEHTKDYNIIEQETEKLVSINMI